MPLLNLKPIIRFSLWITVFVYLIQTATTTTPWLLKFKGKFYLPALHVPNEIQLAINHPLGYDNPYSKSLIATHGWAWSSPLATHPYIIEKSNLKLKNPDRQHWLGTDHLGRDCFGLMLQGLASALSFGLIYSLVCLSLGTGIGLIAGFYPNGYDRAIQSFLVIWKSIPLLYLLIILRAWLPLTKHQVLLVMVAFGWGKFYQLTRALALQNRQGIYMLSCRSLGFKPWRLLLYHLFPLSIRASISYFPWHFIHGVNTLITSEFIGITMMSNLSLGSLIQQAKMNPEAYWLPMGLLILLASNSGIAFWIYGDSSYQSKTQDNAYGDQFKYSN
tara:strand:+ start:2291 stop:3283 length:993 start_codon:yes stop_codon:yes gene_type:complete